MSLKRGDKFLVFGLGALAIVSAGLLAFVLFSQNGGGGNPSGDIAPEGASARVPDRDLVGRGREAVTADVSREETEEEIDPAKFAALIEELKAAILAEEVERANAIIAANPGLLEAAAKMLIGILEDTAPSEKSKRLSIEFLKRLPTEEVRAALRRALERETMLGVRKALLMALGELKDVPAIPIVAKLLLDPNELHEIRVLAADTLGYIGHPDATPALLQMIESLKHSLGNDADKSLISHVLQAISLIKDRRATQPLLALLADRTTGSWLVWQLVRALGGIADPAVTEALLAIARAEATDPVFGKSARLDAIRALFAVAAGGDPAAAKGIIDLFQTMPDETFKKEALHNLAKLADNGEVLKELNTVLESSDQFSYKDLAVRGLAYKGGPESVAKIMETLRASDKYDANDILNKLGQQLLRATDPATRDALRQKIADTLETEKDARVLAGLIDAMGKTGDPALGKVILERVRTADNGTLREQGYYALAYSKPEEALPVLEAAIRDAEKDGQERYGAIEALMYWDTEEAVTVLERIRDGLTAEEDQVMRIQVEGAINKVRANIEAKNRRKK